MKTIKSIIILTASCLPLITTYPQCNQAETELKEHGWSKDIEANTSKPGAVNLPKQQEIVKKVADIIKEFYPKPKGAEITYHGDYDVRKIENQYPNAYDAEILLKNYKCINNKEVLIPYNSSVFVGINALTFMGNNFQMNGRYFTTIKALFVPKDGYLYFNFDETDKYKSEEEWILTYNGKLPFTCLTRKEYVTEARADNAKKLDDKIASLKKSYKVRPKAEQEADRQKMIEGFKKSYQGDAYTKRIEQFNRDYKSDEQRLEEALAEANKYYGNIIKKYDDCLATHSEEYLSQPAIVFPYTREVFDGFEVNMKDKNLVYVLKDDPSYYNKSLPVYSPQYITVLIRHSLENKQAKWFYDAINRKELLDNLYTLLGK